MFAVPKWERDVPNTHSHFKKIKRKHKKHKIQVSTENKVTEFDSDKPDEVLLNTKKKKLGEAFKNDDIEDLLFRESLQNKKSIANLRKNAISNVSKINKKHIKDKFVIRSKLTQNNLDITENTDLKNINESSVRIKTKQNTDHSVFNSKKQQNTNKRHKRDKLVNNFKKSKLTQNNLDITETPDLQKIDKSVVSGKTKQSTYNSVFNSEQEQNTNKRHKKDKLINNDKKTELNQNDQNDQNSDLTESTNAYNCINMKSPDSSQIKKIQNNPIKKQKINELLKRSAQRNSILTNGSKLRQRMLERLKSAQFRYLNEKLYTSSGSEAHQLFESDPTAFQTYHQGYQQQVKKWPVNPLEIIIKKIKKLPKSYIVADMGCGEAQLSRRVAQSVRSFDLVSQAPCVEVCDMAHTPLLAASVHVAVYCLALMGTDLTQYLLEANRILKMGGLLLIAEVESRFDNVELFTRVVQQLGFKLNKLDKTNQVFYFMEFTKTRDPPVKKSKLPAISLKPCLYKKR